MICLGSLKSLFTKTGLNKGGYFKMDNMNNEIEKVKTGAWIIAVTKKGGSVFGQLLSQGNALTQDQGVQVFYRIGVIGSRCIDLLENELLSLKEFNFEDVRDYLEELEEQYGIRCFDQKTGEYIGNSSLLGKVIYDGVWEKFSEDKKKRFVRTLNLQTDEIIEILEVLVNNKKQAGKAHDKRMKALDMQLKFMKKMEKEYDILMKEE